MLEIDVAQIHARQFRSPDTAGIQQFEHGDIAPPVGFGLSGRRTRLDQLHDVISPDRFWKPFGETDIRDIGGRIVGPHFSRLSRWKIDARRRACGGFAVAL